MTNVSINIETSSLLCSANEWTGLYMTGTSNMKELKKNIIFSYSGFLFTDLLACYDNYNFFFVEYPGGYYLCRCGLSSNVMLISNLRIFLASSEQVFYLYQTSLWGLLLGSTSFKIIVPIIQNQLNEGIL